MRKFPESRCRRRAYVNDVELETSKLGSDHGRSESGVGGREQSSGRSTSVVSLKGSILNTRAEVALYRGAHARRYGFTFSQKPRKIQYSEAGTREHGPYGVHTASAPGSTRVQRKGDAGQQTVPEKKEHKSRAGEIYMGAARWEA
ncbi:hypothetical protein E4U43_001579, partial [Claviceps pusilla]